MKKAILSIIFIMAAAIVFGQSESDFVTELTADFSGVVIKKYKGSATSVVIPATIQGMPVKEIGASAFEKEWKLISVVVPDTVIKIGENAFSNCTNLTRINIPDSITIIKRSTFFSCNLSSITLPSNIKEIQPFAFYSNINLSTIIIPDTIEKIKFDPNDTGYGAFNYTKLPLPTQARLRKLGYTGKF